MIKTIVKFFTTKLFFGNLFKIIGSNFLLFSIPTLILFSIFYIPYEYFNFLEFKQRFSGDIFGVYFILARPVIVIFLILFLIISIYGKIKKTELEKIEKIKREEQEKLEKIRMAKEKIDKIKMSATVQIAEKTVTKPIVGAGLGACLGAVIGGSLGVAGKVAGILVAVNGGWILAPVGALVGYLGIKKFNKKRNNKELNTD